jgi:hypothetical protein
LSASLGKFFVSEMTYLRSLPPFMRQAPNAIATSFSSDNVLTSAALELGLP